MIHNVTPSRNTLTVLLFLLILQQAEAQYRPSDYSFKPKPFEVVNDGHQNINPTLGIDGKSFWFTKASHPANTGDEGDQDIWVSEFENGAWQQPTNDLPGLNSAKNDLVIGASISHLVYAMRFENGSGDGLNRIIALRKTNGRFEEDHTIELPKFAIESEFFGFFISADESYVILSMKGENSFGKEDLYVIRKVDGKWVGPTHMGARLNTIGFEMSPFVSSDGKHLYFASEGHGSTGSADIFVSARLDDTWHNWSRPINLGPNINSPDFEAYFCVNEHQDEAYFVSNSGASTGRLLRIQYTPGLDEESPSAHSSASGFLRLEKLPAMNVKLNLIDENEQVVQSITTNDEGYFNLQAFLPDRDYKIALEDSLREIIGEADIYLTNDLGENMVFMNNPDLGLFGFKVLSGKNVRNLKSFENLARSGKVVDKETTITGKVDAYGTLQEKVKLNVVDDENHVVKVIETDEDGYFTFDTDAREKSYFLSVDANASGLVDVYEIYLTNNNSDEDIVVTKTDRHLFEFRTLTEGNNQGLKRLEEEDNAIPGDILTRYGLQPAAANASDASEIIGFLRMNKLPLMDAQVSLMDERDSVVSIVQTDAQGRFVFDENLITGDYRLILDGDQDEKLKGSEIFLAKNPSDVLVYLSDDRTGVFAFKKLASSKPMTLYSLRTSTESGRVVNEKQTSLKGKFQYAALPKAGVKLHLLDEQENIIQVTEVGEDGSFEFENYTVNRNYFINVEDGSGLSDIYEIYLSGSNRNVLVNRTNKYVFSFQVLPSMDVLLSDHYVADEFEQPAKGEMTVDKQSQTAFTELDIADIEHQQELIEEAAALAQQGYIITIRLFQTERTANSGKVTKMTLTEDNTEPVMNALQKAGNGNVSITRQQTTSDQIFIRLESR